jgi:hypothetical protein
MDKCVRVIQDGQPLSAMQQIEKNNKEDKISYRVTGITLVGSNGAVCHLSKPAIRRSNATNRPQLVR